MIGSKNAIGLLASFGLAGIPFLALWVDYPVTFNMYKVSAVIDSIKVEERNEVVDTGIAVGSVDCIYLDASYKILPNGPVVAGAKKLKMCDRSAAIDFVKRHKSRPVEGYWTGGAKFVPTGILGWRRLLLQVALSVILLLVSLACLNAVAGRNKSRAENAV